MSVAHYPGRPGLGVFSSVTPHMNYTVNSYFPSRQPRPSSLRGHKPLKRDIKDTMQHATLINIVAAVNEDINGRSVPRKEPVPHPVRSTVTVISNIMLPHEKTVSIPQAKQRIFSMPEEIVQRKPVYYKHSGDLEVNTQSHLKLVYEGDAYNLKVKKNAADKKSKPPATQIIKTLPNKPRVLDVNFSSTKKNIKPDDKNKPSNENETRVTSCVRRLGSVKIKEPRQVHDISKCDIVDLSDTPEENINPANMSILDDSQKAIPPYTASKIPYIRTKSLPVLFPTKINNRILPPQYQKQPTIYKDRPLSHSLRKQTPDSMYKRITNLPSGFGFGELSINNGINQAPNVSGRLVHDSEKQPTIRSSLSGNSRQRNNRNIGSVASQNIGRDYSTVFITLPNERPDYTSASSYGSSYRSKYTLHEAVQRAMSCRSTKGGSAMTKNDNRSAISARSKKSCLTSRSGLSETLSGIRTPKRVQFISSGSSLNSSDANNPTEEPNSDQVVDGGSSIIRSHVPSSTIRAFSPGIQPMSVRELLRLEQKILPSNTPLPPDISPHYYSTSSLISVHTLLRSNSDLSSRLFISSDDDSDNEVSETKQKESSENNHSEDINDMETTENSSEITEDSMNENEGYDKSTEDDDRDDSGDSDKEGYYKLVKAVDRQPYDGFEHKKLRRTSGNSKCREHEKGTEKARYVKVRLS